MFIFSRYEEKMSCIEVCVLLTMEFGFTILLLNKALYPMWSGDTFVFIPCMSVFLSLMSCRGIYPV